MTGSTFLYIREARFEIDGSLWDHLEPYHRTYIQSRAQRPTVQIAVVGVDGREVRSDAQTIVGVRYATTVGRPRLDASIAVRPSVCCPRPSVLSHHGHREHHAQYCNHHPFHKHIVFRLLDAAKLAKNDILQKGIPLNREGEFLNIATNQRQKN